MKSDWILDVLTDLKTFARANDLAVLAEQLDDTAIIAMTEIAALKERQHRRKNDTDKQSHEVRPHFSETRTG